MLIMTRHGVLTSGLGQEVQEQTAGGDSTFPKAAKKRASKRPLPPLKLLGRVSWQPFLSSFRKGTVSSCSLLLHPLAVIGDFSLRPVMTATTQGPHITGQKAF